MKIQFWGATETVTGSRYLLTIGQLRVLVDCGLFQGFKNLRLKNWENFPIPPAEIDAVLLTHAHLDHSGYLPLLIRNGFHGPIYTTSATRDLCSLLLPDSGYLQEEEARFANRHGFSKHKPALPLYTHEDAEKAMSSFTPVEWRKTQTISKENSADQLHFEFHPAGHLLGAATLRVQGQGASVVFSGDLGRQSDPLTRKPDFDLGGDYLVVESTYGNRVHEKESPEEVLKKVILRTFERQGTLLIPSFAVGRAQLVLHYIRQLKLRKEIPNLPVFLNSPMAVHANEIFCRHWTESQVSEAEARAICATATCISSVEESIALNERQDPKIIIAASGMATGGRVLHHLKYLVPEAKNTVLFVGFQAGGTRGEAMIKGSQEIKIHGEYWPVRAEICHIDSMSAHADSEEVLAWVQAFRHRPKQVFVTHGESTAADSLRFSLQNKLKLSALVPKFSESFLFL